MRSCISLGRFKTNSIYGVQFRRFFSQPKDGKYHVDVQPDDKYIYLNPKEEHKNSLIFLHGLGDTAMGFYDLFLDRQDQFKMVPQTCRVVLPTAPV